MKRDLLWIITFFYLVIPNLIFLLAWVNPFISVFLSLFFLYIFYQSSLFKKNSSNGSFTGIHIFLWFLAAGFCYYAGVGGMQPQESDYFKHNLLIHDLIVNPWPVSYVNKDYHNPILCYYLAYYLPIAWIGKHFSFTGSEWAAFIWTSIGLWLGLSWLLRMTRSVWVVLGVWLMAGINYAYDLIRYWGLHCGYNMNFSSDEKTLNGNVLDQYLLKYSLNPGIVLQQGNTEILLRYEMLWSQLCFVPQHFIPALLGLGWISKSLQERRNQDIVLMASLLALWSPFTLVGFTPFIIFLMYKTPWKTVLSWENAAGVMYAFCIGSYYLSHFPQTQVGSIFSSFTTFSNLAYYLLFIGLNFGLLVLVLGVTSYRLIRNQFLIPLSLVVSWLILVSFIYVGYYNDWLTRVSVPAFIYLYCMTWIIWKQIPAKKSISFLGLSFIIFLGLLTPVRNFTFLFYNKLFIKQQNNIGSNIRDPHQFGEDMSRFTGRNEAEKKEHIERQYLGQSDSFFVKYLMKK
ncbi:hypothetical protein [Siphonobacter sp. SORGH_AS_0500]|uniref:hypothetical protein n=1 Tax=Siphonobacter sp. SORGH_AS_0500 TaxID=1864824 RepID=UPI00286728E0|nr:hypothetical protein [Siphonobacter sp. SORGH_AS_0500]MDR6194148.1 hypothetical protein [Siphonobacter sp. SORGH_AS_0500]